jgi:glycosyltransferase involved in cell wall biosynthesis
MHKVSIILPSYNHDKFLKDRLDSIINQTYTNWKLIIIDDCSTDGSVNILKEFQKNHDDKISDFIINTKNSGSGYNSWKKGIELASSEYIWVAETDDYSDIIFLENMVNALEENKNVSLAFCSSNYVDFQKNNLHNPQKRTEDLNIRSGNYGVIRGQRYIEKMPFDTYITNGSSVVFRKPMLELPKYLFIHKQCSDIFFWTFLLKGSSFIFLNKELNYFRRHEGSTTTKMNILQRKNIYEEKIKYLNYFNQTDKFQVLLHHYIKHYLWNNKKDLFNYGFLKEINNIKYIDIKYYLSTVRFIFNKVKNDK